MADQFTQVKTTGYGSRIMNSITGVLIGIVLFVASFGLLYWNEGRTDTSTIAKEAVEINSTSVGADSSLDGKLVSITGTVDSNETIGDSMFLNPGMFIAVERKVEMYSWIENKSTTSKNNTGGSSTETTTYTYKKDWKESPGNSGNFQNPDGHQNPQKTLDNYNGYATTAAVGVYNFNPANITLPSFTKVQLNAQNITLNQGAVLASDSYVFIPKVNGDTFDVPQVGDLRISYYVLNPGFNGTIFGSLSGNNIESYSSEKGDNLFRLFTGTRENAISTLHSEYTILSWILRLVGFLMMWIGLSLLFAPISVLLDILPIFGNISRALVGIVTFLVAFVLSVVTILVSMVIHNIIALIITLVVVIAAVIFVFTYLKNKKKGGPQVQTIPPPPVQ